MADGLKMLNSIAKEYDNQENEAKPKAKSKKKLQKNMKNVGSRKEAPKKDSDESEGDAKEE